MKLSDLTEKTPLIKDFAQRLAKSVGESVVSVIINKAKRVSGVSVAPIDINLENGQVITIYVRIIDEKPDIYRIDANNKQIPLMGKEGVDFDNGFKQAFNKSVDMVAQFVTQGQAAFDAKRAKQKTTSVTKPNRNATVAVSKQIQELKTQSAELDQQIKAKTDEKQALENQLATLKQNKIA